MYSFPPSQLYARVRKPAPKHHDNSFSHTSIMNWWDMYALRRCHHSPGLSFLPTSTPMHVFPVILIYFHLETRMICRGIAELDKHNSLFS
jgi:hypothetical protein